MRRMLGPIRIQGLVLACIAAGTLLAADRVTLPAMTATLDSPEVQQLIADEEVRQTEVVDRFFREKHTRQEGIRFIEEMRKHPEDYPPGHGQFLTDMAKSAAVALTGRTRAELLGVSNAHCNKSAIYTTTYLKLKILKGPFKGQQVWACASMPVD